MMFKCRVVKQILKIWISK